MSGNPVGRASRAVGRPVQRTDQEQRAKASRWKMHSGRLQAHLELQEDRVAEQAREIRKPRKNWARKASAVDSSSTLEWTSAA